MPLDGQRPVRDALGGFALFRGHGGPACFPPSYATVAMGAAGFPASRSWQAGARRRPSKRRKKRMRTLRCDLFESACPVDG